MNIWPTFNGTNHKLIVEKFSKDGAPLIEVSTLAYQIKIAYQIDVAFGDFSRINKRSLSKKLSFGYFVYNTKRSPKLFMHLYKKL